MDSANIHRVVIALVSSFVSDKIRKPPPIETIFEKERAEEKTRTVEVVQVSLVNTRKSETKLQPRTKPPVLISNHKILSKETVQDNLVKPDMPTTQETIEELKRRLGKELYRVELDLQGGARIAGKPCDCLTKEKHTGGIEATAEELMSYEKDPVYGQIVDWFRKHESEFRPAVIATKDADYYRGLTPEVRGFRKAVMGTEKVGAIFNTEEKEMIRKRAADKMGKELE